MLQILQEETHCTDLFPVLKTYLLGCDVLKTFLAHLAQ